MACFYLWNLKQNTKRRLSLDMWRVILSDKCKLFDCHQVDIFEIDASKGWGLICCRAKATIATIATIAFDYAIPQHAALWTQLKLAISRDKNVFVTYPCIHSWFLCCCLLANQAKHCIFFENFFGGWRLTNREEPPHFCPKSIFQPGWKSLFSKP